MSVPISFRTTPYVVEGNTRGSSNSGDVLYANGSIKEKTDLSGDRITPVFCLLEFLDRGANSSDVSLREAYAEFENPEFAEVTGISGSPVFNATTKKLAGMIVRGALIGNKCTVWYIDMFDIMQFITAIAEPRDSTDYTKTMIRLVRTPIDDPNE
jgi:hypothetical protein